jgi:hypothetical protein
MIQQLIDIGLLPSGVNLSNSGDERYWMPVDDLSTHFSLPVLSSGWYKPDFYIIRDSHGNPVKVKTTIQWGKNFNKIVVVGAECDGFLEALQATYAKATLVEPEDVNIEDLRNNFLVSLSEDRKAFKFQGPVFKAEAKDGVTHFAASLVTKGTTYSSSLRAKKSEAIIELSAIINKVTDLSLIMNIPKPPQPKKSKAANEPTANTKLSMPQPKHSPNKSDMGLLKSLNARWRCEYDWLMKMPKRTLRDDERLFDVSRFLAVGDPLRWFEVSPEDRLVIIEKIKPELEEHAIRQTEQGQLNTLVKYLRAMIKGDAMLPGDPVDVGEKWSRLVYRNGDKPNAILERLVSLKLLRDSGIGARYSLSNRAISLVNIHLKSGFKGGSIGSAIPVETLFAMLKTGAAR